MNKRPTLPRAMSGTLQRLSAAFPVVAITGPRQSGKTTLARTLFADKPYVSLENPAELAFAEEDPRGFLARFADGAIFDEAQRWPALFSWLQGMVDDDRRPGRFILTGSQQFGLMAGITQSLAGRVAVTHLLPLSLAELSGAPGFDAPLDRLLLTGSYPALHAQTIDPQDWFPSYVATYVERDVRQVMNIQDLGVFQRFLRLCAARTGQLLNLAALAGEAGISQGSARNWLAVLESSYLVHRLPPYHRNFGKRLVKAPKLYFLDVGLACWLLGITNAAMLALHPMRGALFETWVVGEFIKTRYNTGQPANLFFWRDSNGLESDLLFETESGLQPVEIKSGQTITPDYIRAGQKAGRITGNKAGDRSNANEETLMPWLVHGGTDHYERSGVKVMSWKDLARSF